MKEELPKVFANKISNINNVQETFYGKLMEEKKEDRSDTLSIESKINRIFNSSNYIYKKEVLINMNNSEQKKIIIGRTPKSLLTIDNEVIDINQIDDIKVI